MLKKNTKKEKKTKEENKKKSVVPRYITFLILSIILGGIFTALTSYAATIAASNISYDNTTSGLSATNAQDAINDLYISTKKFAIGDIVFFVPERQSFKVEGNTYGLDSSYTYNPSELTTWIISRVDGQYVYAASQFMPSQPVKLKTKTCSSQKLTGTSDEVTHPCLKLFKSLPNLFKEIGQSYSLLDSVSGVPNSTSNFTPKELFDYGWAIAYKLRWTSSPYVSLPAYGDGTESGSGLSVDGKYYTWFTGINFGNSNYLQFSWSGGRGYYESYYSGGEFIKASGELYSSSYDSASYIRPFVRIKKAAITGGTGSANTPFVLS